MNEEIKIPRDTRDAEQVSDSPTGAAAAPAREKAREARIAEPVIPGMTRRDQEPITPLFATDQAQALRSRWETVQVSCVDEPRDAVQEADRLVSEAINSLSKSFAAERETLEQQWNRGEDASTEDLRRYRSFFERLLSV